LAIALAVAREVDGGKQKTGNEDEGRGEEGQIPEREVILVGVVKAMIHHHQYDEDALRDVEIREPRPGWRGLGRRIGPACAAVSVARRDVRWHPVESA